MGKNWFFGLTVLLLACILLLVSCGEKAVTGDNSGTDDPQSPGGDAADGATEPALKDAPRDSLPEMDFGGYVFKILSDDLEFINAKMNFEEETGDILNDSIYARNRKIEERFNIVIKEDEGVAKIKNIVKSGSDEYSIFTYWCATMLSYFVEGLGYKFPEYSLYIDLERPYWNSGITGAMTFGGEVLFPIGASCLPSYDYTHVLLFNKQMVTDFALENPYNIVASGGWTFDRYGELAKAAIRDLDGNGIMDDKDIYGYVAMPKYILPIFWVAAGVESIVNPSGGLPEFNLRSNERFASAVAKAYAITYDNNSWYRYFGAEDLTPATDWLFMNDRSLFFDCTFKRIVDMRRMDTDFGILPYPKYDESQSAYYTFMEGCDPFMIPVTVANPEKIGAIMEALTCESYNSVIPVYYDISLKTKHARDEESADMIDLIFSNCVFDLGNTLWSMPVRDGFVFTMFKKNNRNVASELEKAEPQVNREITKTLKALGLG